MNKNLKKVLLVDDDTLLRELLGLIVEKHGYQLKKAENGRDATDLVNSFQPDLIVLDVMMPIMDGRQFLTWFNTQDSNSNILVLTSSTDEKLHTELYDLGATKVATKPISIKVLENEMRMLLAENSL